MPTGRKDARFAVIGATPAGVTLHFDSVLTTQRHGCSMSLFDGLKARVQVRSKVKDDARDAGAVESASFMTASTMGAIAVGAPTLNEPPAVVAVSTHTVAVPEFDEFGAPEGAFGRFRGDLNDTGPDPDEHTRFAC